MVRQKEDSRAQADSGSLPNAPLRSTAGGMRRELLAGVVSFFAIVYIIIVNASILADAGIPQEAGIVATVLASAAGCFIMGWWGKAPIILVPGMGINAMFTYTLVHGMGLTWQQALAVVFISGICFTIISFTTLAEQLRAAIPDSLQEAISVGIGLMLVLIGLQKGGVIVSDASTIIAVQSFGEPGVWVTFATLALTCILFMRKVPGHLLIAIIFGTALAYVTGAVSSGATGAAGEGRAANEAFSWAVYGDVFGQFTLEGVSAASMAIAVFSLTLVIVFENVGLINAQLNMCRRPERFQRAMQANALSVVTCGIFGTSPTVATVETAAGISAGGRTGWTSIVTGSLFLVTLVALPLLTFVPDQAVAPILIFIGGLMMPAVKKIRFEPMAEGLPAFFIIAFIPLMHSIVDGIAIGFVSYALFQIAVGKAREVKPLFYVISVLFAVHFVLQAL
ncbi:NCS2 family permease [Paenibacillus apiarius]|uniref:NCS2 family permease n=1 Tax=Paenibacillus apiarius TaxID=46240 RepID=A0ABT4DSY5_9BACL|nr:NCS2 family permease [Paenibacillus apiarius]MCY9516702.1 NCS2 family permease [Paenibacillus apiarius]MCY9519900.1 NCS2 family permease [Paenibacillus apiarius]MCY9553862.1 NCS2 family permease [Paenibacillus apiarius]MCY9557530.1 NCS2 family permease [Paenibacillus apiarius]MCY9685490.1 NCS2 family permease [Paenibacillus apiarius]